MFRAKLFLKARWEHLILASYKVDPALLLEYLPQGLELDTIDENAFVSLVAFNFADTAVKGIKVPFHINFPEINLRFYVKDKQRRGVVFIREFVPRFFISLFANVLFNENYRSVPMKSKLEINRADIKCSHEIKLNGNLYYVSLESENKMSIPPQDSTGHFFKEHEWGFGRTRKGKTLVYKVEHPFWEVYPIVNFEHNFDFGRIYGDKWKSLNNEAPYNITFAKGSQIKVYSAQTLSP
ncbi:MAG TPA: DUF2071 domain-containing protein [Ignavibacteria bacterium]|jgi:hypothetical protein